MQRYNIQSFPKTRIATIDVCNIGKKKHHIAAFLEIDVTLSREKIKKYKKDIGKISFFAWLIKAIGQTISDNKSVTSYLAGKHKTIVFDDINISILVEKKVNGEKIPLPLLIEKVNSQGIEAITKKLNVAKEESANTNQVVIQKKTNYIERVYFYLPGFIRRFFWNLLLNNPKIAYAKMGNVAITSVGMYGKINGWFLPIAVHPICFGIGSIIKKPVVIDDKIEIREIINISVLLDHDVIDGASMSRFLGKLTKNIEKGILL